MTPKRNYIFLSGANGTANGNAIEFQIPPHAFNNHVPNSIMTVQLISVSWYTDMGADTPGGIFNITSQIANRNQYSSNNQVWLASGKYEYQLASTTHYLQAVSLQASCELICEPFTSISFTNYISENSMTFTAGEIDDMVFVLQIDYEY